MKLPSIIRERLGALGLVVWFLVMAITSAGFLARHLIALPVPRGEEVASALSVLRSATQKHRWLAVHVLDAECRCSQRVAEHLAATDRPADWAEMVLWVGTDAPPSEISKRFDVRRLDAAELASLGVEAAPTVFVLDPEDRVRYAGGYSSKKQGPVIEDLRILNETRAGHPVASLPVFGCAISSRLKKELSALPGTVSTK